MPDLNAKLPSGIVAEAASYTVLTEGPLRSLRAVRGSPDPAHCADRRSPRLPGRPQPAGDPQSAVGGSVGRPATARHRCAVPPFNR